MVSCFREVCETCDDLKIFHDMSSKDWQLVHQMKDILKPFAEAVKHLEGDKYVTIAEVYPILFSLRDKLPQV